MEEEILNEDILEELEETEPEMCDCGECQECIEAEGSCDCGDCDMCVKDSELEEDLEESFDDLEPEDLL
ncbi:hypothetical protein KKC45_02150 [Patescibacteria group bacterium]|nr:hypothetical protein [Patescibacteria group bacterium]